MMTSVLPTLEYVGVKWGKETGHIMSWIYQLPLQTNYEFSVLKCGKNKDILYSGRKHTAKKNVQNSKKKKMHSIRKIMEKLSGTQESK